MERRVSQYGRITYFTEDDPHAVYRMYDAEDHLLYIGMSCNPGARFRDHRARKPWAKAAVRWTEEWHPSRKAAEAAEKAAIKTEKPERNGSHTEYGRAMSLSHLGPGGIAGTRVRRQAIREARELEIAEQRAQQIAEGKTTTEAGSQKR